MECEHNRLKKGGKTNPSSAVVGLCLDLLDRKLAALSKALTLHSVYRQLLFISNLLAVFAGFFFLLGASEF